MPAGELATVPAPLPLVATDKGLVPVVLKVAVTDAAAVKVTVQGPVPLQPAPLQPWKTEAPTGAAVSVTVLPEVKLARQVAPQLIPAGLLVTRPVPAPAGMTVRTTPLPLPTWFS